MNHQAYSLQVIPLIITCPFFFYKSLTSNIKSKGLPPNDMHSSPKSNVGRYPSQSETILWAKNTLGIEISQTQVSKWSSDRFKHLAAPQDKSLTTYTSTPKRRRERNLHNLELALYTWLKQYETRALITGPVHGTVVPTVTEASLATSCTEAELVPLAERVASQRGIQNIPSINDFVTPTSEEVFDDINTLEELYLEEIAELFDSEILIENDEEDFEELGSGADSKKVDMDETIAATKLLLKWLELSGDGDGAKHLTYTRDLRQLQIRQEDSRKQTTITSFFSVDEG
ncbi:hypothetical protein K3495_g3449 [Podosphaera aphanis]|nr:hypothetical protein K3495_g3449 [Podosphaera aphanis]